MTHNFVRTASLLYLRFCPLCLQETGYYRNYWRFKSLIGCAIHNCRLEERCYACGLQIPVFDLQQSIGICPSCNSKLSDCPIIKLTDVELASTVRNQNDLQYLLTYQAWEGLISNIAHRLGAFLKYQRQLKEMSRADFATKALLRVIDVGKVEGGREVPFHCYYAYARGLGLSLQDMFNEITQEDFSLARIENFITKQQSIVSRIQELVAYEQATAQHMSISSIAKTLNLGVDELLSIPQVVNLLTNRRALKRKES